MGPFHKWSHNRFIWDALYKTKLYIIAHFLVKLDNLFIYKIGRKILFWTIHLLGWSPKTINWTIRVSNGKYFEKLKRFFKTKINLEQKEVALLHFKSIFWTNFGFGMKLYRVLEAINYCELWPRKWLGLLEIEDKRFQEQLLWRGIDLCEGEPLCLGFEWGKLQKCIMLLGSTFIHNSFEKPVFCSSCQSSILRWGADKIKLFNPPLSFWWMASAGKYQTVFGRAWNEVYLKIPEDFNQEEALVLVAAFSVIVKSSGTFR